MRYYSDLEIDFLIDEIREAAREAIERAAGEAARAAFLESVEREAAALREAARWRLQARANALALDETRRAGRKNAVVAGAAGLVGGFVFGFAVSR